MNAQSSSIFSHFGKPLTNLFHKSKELNPVAHLGELLRNSETNLGKDVVNPLILIYLQFIFLGTCIGLFEFMY